MDRQAIDQAIEVKSSPTSDLGHVPQLNAGIDEAKLLKRRESQQDFYQNIISAATSGQEPSAAQTEVFQQLNKRSSVRSVETPNGQISGLVANETNKTAPAAGGNAEVLLARSNNSDRQTTAQVTDKRSVVPEVNGVCASTSTLGDCKTTPVAVVPAQINSVETRGAAPSSAAPKLDLARTQTVNEITPIIQQLQPQAPAAVASTQREVIASAPNGVQAGRQETTIPAPNTVAPRPQEVVTSAPNTVVPIQRETVGGGAPNTTPIQSRLAEIQVAAVPTQAPARQPADAPVAVVPSQGQPPVERSLTTVSVQVPSKEPIGAPAPVVSVQVPGKEAIGQGQVRPVTQSGETSVVPCLDDKTRQPVQIPVKVEPAKQPSEVQVPAVPVRVEPTRQPGEVQGPAVPVRVEPTRQPGEVQVPAVPVRVEPTRQPGEVQVPAVPVRVEPTRQPGEVQVPAVPVRVEPTRQPGEVQVPAVPVKVEPVRQPGEVQVPAVPVKVEPVRQPGEVQVPAVPLKVEPARQPSEAQVPAIPVKVDLVRQPGEAQVPTIPVRVEPSRQPGEAQVPTIPVRVEPSRQPGEAQVPAVPVRVEPSRQPGEAQVPVVPVRVEPARQPGEAQVPAAPLKVEPARQPSDAPIVISLNPPKQNTQTFGETAVVARQPVDTQASPLPSQVPGRQPVVSTPGEVPVKTVETALASAATHSAQSDAGAVAHQGQLDIPGIVKIGDAVGGNLKPAQVDVNIGVTRPVVSDPRSTAPAQTMAEVQLGGSKLPQAELPNGIRVQTDPQGNISLRPVLTDVPFNVSGTRIPTGTEFNGIVPNRMTVDQSIQSIQSIQLGQPIRPFLQYDGTTVAPRTTFNGAVNFDAQQTYRADLVNLPIRFFNKSDDFAVSVVAATFRATVADAAMMAVRNELNRPDVRTELTQRQFMEPVARPVVETSRAVEPIVRQDVVRAAEFVQPVVRSADPTPVRQIETRAVTVDSTPKSFDYSQASAAATRVVESQITPTKAAEIVRPVDQQVGRVSETQVAINRPVEPVRSVIEQPVRAAVANVTVPERTQPHPVINNVEQPLKAPVFTADAVRDLPQIQQIVSEPFKGRVQIVNNTPEMIRETPQISNIHISSRVQSENFVHQAATANDARVHSNSIINDPSSSALHVSSDLQSDLFDMLSARHGVASEKRELPSIRSVFGLSEFIFGDKSPEDEESGENKKEQSSAVPQISKTVATRRVKYIVQNGDTLNSIAASKLGDSRFADLLITINRAEIHFVDIEGTVTPTVYEGQLIWLPALQEVEIYKKNFFNTKSRSRKSLNAYTPISIERVDIPVMTPVITPIFQCFEEEKTVISANLTPVDQIDVTTNVSANLNKVEAPVFEQEHVDSISNRRCYQVRLGETLQSVALRDPIMKDTQLWKLLAMINGLSTDSDEHGRAAAKLIRGQYLVLPTEDEVKEFRLLNKLYGSVWKHACPTMSCSPDSTPISHAPSQQEMPVCFEIEKLADDCRLIIAGSNTGSTVFSIAQQILINAVWTTIVRYDCNGIATARSTFDRSGQKRTFNVDLPVHVAMQLALEDLRRNYRRYCQGYLYSARFQAPQFAVPTLWK